MNRTILLSITAAIAMAATARSETPDSTATPRELKEMVVHGEKPLIKGSDGMMVVDLPGIVGDKPVSNILEALGYLPGVVNNNGYIGLAGASSVSIIINGELTNMPVENLYQVLYSIPVDRLKNVEVMYTAPAKYHVDGAVINVVLKTPTPLDGLRGQVRTGYNQRFHASYGCGLGATYAVNDWTFDLNYGLSRTKNRSREEASSNHLFEGSRTLIYDDMRRTSESLTNTIYASATYKKLRVTYNGQISSAVKGRSLSTGTLGDFSNDFGYDGPVNYQNVAVRYTAPFGMTIGGDYTYYKEVRTQTMHSGEATLLSTLKRQAINRWHAYVDQEHHLGQWQLNYGVEYQRADDKSSQSYTPAEIESDFEGTSTEDVADAYVGLQRSFDWGLSFNVSAKGEYFRNDYGHNWNFIPQVGATYYTTPKSIFQLNLSTRRIYPSYWELHRLTSYINPYAKVIGNPALQPYLSYEGQLSYIFKQKYVATLYVQYADKAAVQLPYQSPDELSLIYQTINMNFKCVTGLNLNVPFKVGYVWDATATANFFLQREKADHFHHLSFDNKKWIFYAELNNTIRFSEDCPVALSVDLACITPSTQGIADLSGMWRVDAGLKWKFGRKRSCELTLQANDIFNSWSPTMAIERSGQDYRMKVHDMTRNLQLTFVWRFNGFKPQQISPDTSRFGTGK